MQMEIRPFKETDQDALVETAWARLRARGASSATVTDRSFGFWQRIGFERLPVFVVLRTSDGQALASSAG